MTELEREVGEARATVERLEVETRCKDWSHADELKEKQVLIERSVSSEHAQSSY